MSIVLKRNVGGQLKIQQMVFMLLAVTLFFILVLLFYFAIKTVSLRDDVTNLRRNNAADLVAKIASSPEFIFEGKAGAVDADKVMVLREMEEYDGYWKGVEGIIIQKIYPAGNVECKLANYPDCGVIKLFTREDKASASAYVALCRKESIQGVEYDKCELARLMIEIEELEDE